MTFKDRSRAYRNDLSFSKRVPDGDAISRNICDHCGLINYENPKIVAALSRLAGPHFNVPPCD